MFCFVCFFVPCLLTQCLHPLALTRTHAGDISQDALDEVLADTRPMAVEETEQSRMAGRLVPHLRAITDTATEAVQARTAADAQARIVDMVNTLKVCRGRRWLCLRGVPLR